MEVHTGTEIIDRRRVRAHSAVFAAGSAIPPRVVWTLLSLSLQCTMNNTKDTKRGININKQKYTELIFTCLLNVRNSSYTHKVKKNQKEQIKTKKH